MKICRFNHDRIGIIRQQRVYDITPMFHDLPPAHWPAPPADWMISHFPFIAKGLGANWERLESYPLEQVSLNAPVANPGKIVAAPINYRDHIAEANADQQINHGKVYTDISEYGLFLKANSSLCGPNEVIELPIPGRRTDPEVELAVVIGQRARNLPVDRALEAVFGYAIGIDMTVRGSEFPSFRKSADNFSVLGPWIITPDEIGDPNALDLSIRVNGQLRQQSNTRHLIYNVQRLIAYASAMFTLWPGDVIYTGTPSGVSAIQAGDRIDVSIERIGAMSVTIADSVP
ncbi:Ureidoglycolate lyase [Serratia quinivorans]|nr:Ureidoglycolate lyase [Serratia quinivorans]CAI1947637.1 Ureidoglycolate lyase [Serratia quinivorans]